MTDRIETLQTPDGPFTVLVDAHQRVLASGWTADHMRVVERVRPAERPAVVTEGAVDAVAAVRAYYSGDLGAIDAVEVRQYGSAGQVAGWRMLRAIRPGEPWTYTRFAAALGSPRAVRAAASICARNAPALFVPCHRVVRVGGDLGGFAWGLEVKRSLLAREAAAARDPSHT